MAGDTFTCEYCDNSLSYEDKLCPGCGKTNPHYNPAAEFDKDKDIADNLFDKSEKIRYAEHKAFSLDEKLSDHIVNTNLKLEELANEINNFFESGDAVNFGLLKNLLGRSKNARGCFDRELKYFQDISKEIMIMKYFNDGNLLGCGCLSFIAIEAIFNNLGRLMFENPQEHQVLFYLITVLIPFILIAVPSIACFVVYRHFELYIVFERKARLRELINIFESLGEVAHKTKYIFHIGRKIKLLSQKADDFFKEFTKELAEVKDTAKSSRSLIAKDLCKETSSRLKEHDKNLQVNIDKLIESTQNNTVHFVKGCNNFTEIMNAIEDVNSEMEIVLDILRRYNQVYPSEIENTLNRIKTTVVIDR